MATKGKRYDKDFKLGAVKMVLEKGRATTSVAAILASVMILSNAV